MLELPPQRSRTIALLALSVFFVAAGVNHFLRPAFYLTIMPPYLPMHLELVYLSGALEVLGGVAVLVPRIRAGAGWGLIAVLVGIFPANVHMAVNPDLYPDLAPLALYLRLPVQGLFIWWAYWATRPPEAANRT